MALKKNAEASNSELVPVGSSSTHSLILRSNYFAQRGLEDLARLENSVDTSLDLGHGVKLDLVKIPAGKFTMGSPPSERERHAAETQHEVALTRSFYLGKYPVTQKQYKEIMGCNPSLFKNDGSPVEQVLWEEAVSFCEKLSAKTGRKIRLPSEAEWEYACRAGTSTRFYSGEDEESLKNVAWFAANSEKKTHPVGQKKPNAWGLYDIHGNVWEWCLDWFGEYPFEAQTDPKGAEVGVQRVLRGGSWIRTAKHCRSACRFKIDPAEQFYYGGVGFRVVMEMNGN